MGVPTPTSDRLSPAQYIYFSTSVISLIDEKASITCSIGTFKEA